MPKAPWSSLRDRVKAQSASLSGHLAGSERARRVVEAVRGRRLGPALGAIALFALLIGVIIGTGLPGSSKGANTPKASGAATVERRDLVATDTESGTLGYANPQTVYNRVSGTVTWLPTIGQVIKPGGTLYKVDNAPVVLFDGAVPAYRDLTSGVTDGPDVLELNQNLVKLGFDPSHEITVNDTWQSGTTDAVERWQASVGETQTGTVTFGQIVFLPGDQRITDVNTVLGSNGSSSSAGSGSGSGSAASTTVVPHTEFVSLTTTSIRPATPTPSAKTTTAAEASSADAATVAQVDAAETACKQAATAAHSPSSKCPSVPSGGSNETLKVLLALLKAETLELQKELAGGGSAGGRGAGGGSTGGSAGGGSGFSGGGGGGGASGTGGAGSSFSGGGGGGGGGSAGAGSGSAAGSGAGSGSGTAEAILDTTSTQEVVTVQLDATKQTEAVVGEPVTVEMPDGTTVNGKITEVSPVAQNSSGSGSGSGSGGSGSGSGGSSGGSGSSGASATIPVTITLTGHEHVNGLDQAAVSVNFEQQKANNVLSVPVTALIATAGGGYAVQEALAPHRLLPVTPGLFAAGYVQISGADIYEGLQVTDSQG
jgi:Putative peptidoglycan binding domain